jgi:hypothetical protein
MQRELPNFCCVKEPDCTRQSRWIFLGTILQELGC